MDRRYISKRNLFYVIFLILFSVFAINKYSETNKIKKLSENILIISFDDENSQYAAIWPIPRKVHVDLIGRISNYQPKSIIYTIIFSGKISKVDDDLLSNQVISKHNIWWMVGDSQKSFLGNFLKSYPDKRFFTNSTKQSKHGSWTTTSWNNETQTYSLSAVLHKEIYGLLPSKNVAVKFNVHHFNEIPHITIKKLSSLSDQELTILLTNKIVIVVKSYANENTTHKALSALAQY